MEVIIQHAISITIGFSVVPLVAVACGAGLVSLLQAVTQVQEQSLVHLARLVVMYAVLALFGSSAFRELEALLIAVFSAQDALGIK